MFGIEGDVTKKQLKKLRKESSVFVRDILAKDLAEAIENIGLNEFVAVNVEPDGDGDSTYPEPRRIHIIYKSVFSSENNQYLREEVLLEVGARSLFEPTANSSVDSFVAAFFPHLMSKEAEIQINSAIAEKTFLEKAFLLHELFTTDGCRNANRKSRHLYDLCKMMDAGIADNAIADDALWEAIRHHRAIFTSVRDVDYTPVIRKRISLVPPRSVIEVWKNDYETMVSNMIYEDDVPPFDAILESVAEIERKFKAHR